MSACTLHLLFILLSIFTLAYISNVFVSFVFSAAKDETIHVFSLASGHLYERFLKIMMQSVVQNTKSPVKFWFVANFLSPKFKEFVPKMVEDNHFLCL